MPKAKIELSYEDLVKLLTDKETGEVSIEVKNTIVQAFTQRHLKALVNNEAMDRVTALLRSAVAAEIAEQVGTQTSAYSGSTMNLVPGIKKLIKEMVEQEMRIALMEVISKAKEDILSRLSSDLESRVNSALSVEISTVVRKQVDEKLKKAKDALTS